jgi:hypothetical protein
MRTRSIVGAAVAAVAAGTAGWTAYLGVVTGAVAVDLGVGRRLRPLGPITVTVSAPRQTVYDVLAAPYVERPSRAMREKVEVLDRGAGLVLAAHRTPLRRGLTAVTTETVGFHPPARMTFRLVRGPVPHVVESFELVENGDRTTVHYVGELGTDLWAAGARWGDLVARAWESAVRESLQATKVEAERRAH